MDTILLALKVTQGHKHSYQTSSYSINTKPMGTILSALKVNMDTSIAIKQAIKRSMPNQWTRSYWLWMSHRDTSIAIKQALNRSIPNQWAQSYRLWKSIWTQAQLSNKLLSDQCQANGHDLIGSECHKGTQAKLSNKHLILSMPNLKAQSQLVCFNED